MALPLYTLAFAMAMVIASAKTEEVRFGSFQGSVLCIDCGDTYDYSGIAVLVECDSKKKQAIAITEKDGSFEAELLANAPSLANCKARLVGGPNQLYGSKKSIVSEVVGAGPKPKTYTTKTTLKFASSCSSVRKMGKCGGNELGASKTIDLPIPKEYGFPPTSYYIPILPIIGIP